MKALLFIFITTIISSHCSAQEKLDGKAIAQKAYNVEDGSSLQATMEMTIAEKEEITKTRTLLIKRRDSDSGDQVRIEVCEPQLLKGTAFLVWNQRNESNSLWLYLPSQKQARRLSSSSQYQSFIGSDFSYDDLTKINLNDHSFKRLSDQNGDYVIDVFPNDPHSKAPTKRRVWIDHNNFMIKKIELYKKDELIKVFETLKLETIDNILTITHSQMRDLKENRQTNLTLKNISYNKEIKGSSFRATALTKGGCP